MRQPRRERRRAARVVVMTAIASAMLGACIPMTGDWGDILGGLGNTVNGEIRSIDSRRNSLTVRQDYGDTRTVRFDDRTRVYRDRRESRVHVLERGDRVRIRLAQDRRGTEWAERIDVEDSRTRRDPRDGDYGRVERVSGEVRQVDTRRGWFTIRQGRGGDLTVVLPSRVSRDDQRRFDRLRRGNRVSADVRLGGRGQAELVRFR